MKKIFTLLMAALAILPATAQLRVINNGSVHVGNYSTGSFSHVNAPERAVITTPTIAISDTTATHGYTEMVGGIVKVGSDVTPLKEKGQAVFSKGSLTNISADTIELEPGTMIKKGAKVSIINSKK